MSVGKKPLRGSGVSPDHIMISIYSDARTTMAVTWRTCIDVKSGYVEYREEGGEVKVCEAVFEVFESDIDISNIFWAHLQNLKPGTKYYYTCGDKEHRSGEYSFTTEPENLTKFKFICVADQQKGEPHDCPDYSYFNKFVKRILAENPDTRFILTGGDNTDCGQHEVQWNGAFSGLVGISESMPFMMSLGNHDNRGFQDYKKGIGRFYSEPAEFFAKQFKGSYPFNGPRGWETENYAFNYGNARFYVIGINEPEIVNKWLIDELGSCDKAWKLGVYHFPICYSGADCQNYDAYPVMREGMEKFDIMFSGHEHNFSRSFPLKNEELFDRPSQGTIHYMLGNSHQNPPGSRTLSKIWHTAFYPQEEQNAMVVIVEVDGDKLTLTALLDDGRIVDKCVVDKAGDTILPHSVAPIFNRTRMMFKGMDPGLCQADTPCENVGGIWFAPLSVLVGYIGGTVEKTKGRLFLEMYGHSAVFEEGSGIMRTDRGEVKLEAPVFRGRRGQLYIPVSAVEAFEMRWAYSPRNNFISFEHESQKKLITEQP